MRVFQPLKLRSSLPPGSKFSLLARPSEQGKVSGILDFEFSVPDWRVMEPTVALSKVIEQG